MLLKPFCKTLAWCALVSMGLSMIGLYFM